ncbi:hypothetical protein B0H16DRAFT_1470352 [Mycena metata]|uniref:Uncharacterized protein n=1 Tax=Mycena metata TaxID=1033252 RepID=A0AAD7HUM8_9AGAR|nr:hypothetical protein B0H16DRAFT_1470352 [Mycena metata]
MTQRDRRDRDRLHFLLPKCKNGDEGESLEKRHNHRPAAKTEEIYSHLNPLLGLALQPIEAPLGVVRELGVCVKLVRSEKEGRGRMGRERRAEGGKEWGKGKRWRARSQRKKAQVRRNDKAVKRSSSPTSGKMQKGRNTETRRVHKGFTTPKTLTTAPRAKKPVTTYLPRRDCNPADQTADAYKDRHLGAKAVTARKVDSEGDARGVPDEGGCGERSQLRV